MSTILSPSQTRHTALVKVQGPFADRQLESICRGLVYLQKLGLVPIIVVDLDHWHTTPAEQQPSNREQRDEALREMERVVSALAKLGAQARPILQIPVQIGADGKPLVESADLVGVTSAVLAGEIPVLPPLVLETGVGLNVKRGDAGDVIRGLVGGMISAARRRDAPAPSAEEGSPATTSKGAPAAGPPLLAPLDLTPYRLMVINREGGIPSYARSGLPHLTINLASEAAFIKSTFAPDWADSHPTALANLKLAEDCLKLMPESSTALVVSHRSSTALIGNLITNKPAHSPSLPHALLDSQGKLTAHTPTLIRRGLPIQIIRNPRALDREKLTTLLEASFRRKLDQAAFYDRMERHLDFVIVAGDYAGAAVITREWAPSEDPTSPAAATTAKPPAPVCYLDKFAVLPSHQGATGTVDFLWSTLRDETFGAGLPSALNTTPGSLAGTLEGRDLVWRSRADNPVNKWYFERSNGFLRTGGADGKWKMFWCDREDLAEGFAHGEDDGGGMGGAGRDDEVIRLERWADVVEPIPSAWSD